MRELEIIIVERGPPAMCVSDNGTELTGIALESGDSDREMTLEGLLHHDADVISCLISDGTSLHACSHQYGWTHIGLATIAQRH